MFRVHHTQFEYGIDSILENRVTGEMIPARAETENANPVPTRVMLTNLGRHIDEDFLILRRENDVVEDAKYVLEAHVICAPSGWNPQDKLGKKLAEIHGPVPAYGKKIEGSMDKFFRTIEAGKYVKRANWSITMGGELFTPHSGTNHAKAGDDVPEFDGELDPDNVSRSQYDRRLDSPLLDLSPL